MKEKNFINSPFGFSLGILVNLILVLAVELLLIFRYPLPLEEPVLAHIDARYTGSTVSCLAQSGRYQYYQVQSPEGQRVLIPVKTHVFLDNRGRVYPGNAVDMDSWQEGETLSIPFGLRQHKLTMQDGQIHAAASGMLYNIQTVAGRYLLIGICLTLAEWFLTEKIRGEI